MTSSFKPRYAASRLGPLAFAVLPAATIITGCATGNQTREVQHVTDNREAVRASFERWKAGTGSPFELLADSASWTIAGSSPHSRTYRSKQEFLDEVIVPFNARLSRPLVPTVREVYADGDTVIVLFDGEAMARDGVAYHNSYVWIMEMRGGKAVRVTAFFDTRLFDEFWARVKPGS